MKKITSNKLTGNSESCPHCGANLIAGDIPKESQQHYGNNKHFLRVIGIERLGEDRISSWKCPDCGKEDQR